ncbi:hypothetical protein ACROYT_G032078 [Oculina patagonica]
MTSDLKVPICVTGIVLFVIFCTVASVANGVLLIVLYKDPLKCFRKPIVVYIAALALLDFLSGCVTGAGVTHNYILCALGRESSSSLEGTKFAAVAAEFTICTANLLAVLLSVERLCAVAFPILYRRKSTVRRSLIWVGCGVLYTLTFTLSGLAGPQWKRTPLRFHMITTVPFVTLIAVNIALVFAIRWQNRKTQYLMESMEDATNPSSSESKRRQKEKALTVTTQLVVTCFVISLLPYLAFIFMGLYFPRKDAKGLKPSSDTKNRMFDNNTVPSSYPGSSFPLTSGQETKRFFKPTQKGRRLKVWRPGCKQAKVFCDFKKEISTMSFAAFIKSLLIVLLKGSLSAPSTNNSTASESLASVSCEESPLGVQDHDRLPDSSFSASSFFEQTFAPSMARLNGKFAWCAKTTNVRVEYLEIHIPYADRICAIATQGTGFKYKFNLSNTDESVTEYSVEYSDDGSHWEKIEKEFIGNTGDTDSISKQQFPVPVKATYIRIRPQEYRAWICMRVELYGLANVETLNTTRTAPTTKATPNGATTSTPPKLATTTFTKKVAAEISLSSTPKVVTACSAPNVAAASSTPKMAYELPTSKAATASFTSKVAATATLLKVASSTPKVAYELPTSKVAISSFTSNAYVEATSTTPKIRAASSAPKVATPSTPKMAYELPASKAATASFTSNAYVAATSTTPKIRAASSAPKVATPSTPKMAYELPASKVATASFTSNAYVAAASTTPKIRAASSAPKVATPSTPKMASELSTSKVATASFTSNVTAATTTPKVVSVSTTPKIRAGSSPLKIATASSTSKVAPTGTVPTAKATPNRATTSATQNGATTLTPPMLAVASPTPKIRAASSTPKVAAASSTPKLLSEVSTSPKAADQSTTPKAQITSTTQKVTNTSPTPKEDFPRKKNKKKKKINCIFFPNDGTGITYTKGSIDINYIKGSKYINYSKGSDGIIYAKGCININCIKGNKYVIYTQGSNCIIYAKRNNFIHHTQGSNCINYSQDGNSIIYSQGRAQHSKDATLSTTPKVANASFTSKTATASSSPRVVPESSTQKVETASTTSKMAVTSSTPDLTIGSSTPVVTAKSSTRMVTAKSATLKVETTSSTRNEATASTTSNGSNSINYTKGSSYITFTKFSNGISYATGNTSCARNIYMDSSYLICTLKSSSQFLQNKWTSNRPYSCGEIIKRRLDDFAP